MENNFWLDKWQEGEIGFHQAKVMPLLKKHWPHLGITNQASVIVPLAGKTMDVAWLAQQGHEVCAVELSPLAVEQFFNEHNLQPQVEKTAKHTIYRCDNITYICGDIFDLEANFFGSFQACYDRAALIALPVDLRNRYVAHVYDNLATNSKGLLITIDYLQNEMKGPPFAIGPEMVATQFSPKFAVRELEYRDILAAEPKFAQRGLSKMYTGVFELTKNNKV